MDAVKRPVTDSDDLANYDAEFTALQSELSSLTGETFNSVALFGSSDLSVNVSEDGSHVFFTSPSQYNGEGEAGKANLYVWSRADRSVKYIATVAARDLDNYGANGEAGLTNWTRSIVTPPIYYAMDHSRSTPDGGAFAFESSAAPPGFDNTEANADDCGTFYKGKQPCNEVYLYDVRTDELHCVSCGAGGGPATGAGTSASTSLLKKAKNW